MAAIFDGSTSAISFGSASILDNIFDGGGTAMAWIRLSTWGENSRGRIWNKASGTQPAGGWAFWTSSLYNYLAFAHDFGTTYGAWGTATNSIVLNTIYHVAVTYDNGSTANNPTMYINGQSVSVVEDSTPSGTRISDATQLCVLGNHSDASRTFDGWLADPRLYNRILSAEEIQTIYESRGNDGIVDDLVCRPALNEQAPGTTTSTDGVVKDVSPYKHFSDQAVGGSITYIEEPLNWN